MACADHYTLKREGLTAQARGLDALSPAYSQVDERSVSDLVLFAKGYAAFIRYFNSENQIDGNWQDLMRQNPSVAWASLLALDGNAINRYRKSLFKNIDLAYRDGNRDEAKKQFKYLFDLLYGLVKTVDEQAAFLSGQDEQGQAICDILERKMASAYRQLRYLKNENPSLFANNAHTDPAAPVDVVDSSAAMELICIDATEEILPVQLPATTILNKIHYLAHHNVFAGQVSALLGGVSQAVKNAQEGFAASLAGFSGHEPHYALFLAFLKLFGHAQDSLNQFGKRHLDFYYKEVLRLQNKKAQPDTAFLAFELQKAVSQHKLGKGTLFKGGKDGAGAERQYALREDVVLNKASVTLLQAAQLREGRLLVAPIANSADGHGEPIAAGKSWLTFGDPTMAPTNNAGFALASPMLFLKEGTRTINLLFKFGSKLPAPPSSKQGELVGLPFTIRLTGEDGWWEQEVEVSYAVGASQFELTATLDVADPAIVPYSEKVHELGFATGLPLLLAYFRQEGTATTYKSLMETPLASLTIGVDAKGIKDLALSNDSGTIDSAKPFKPFGDFPKLGANFNIGSKEVFQKNLTSLHINGLVTPSVSFQYLHGGEWNSVSATKQAASKRYRATFGGANAWKTAKADFGADNYLGVQSHEGFLRMKLQDATYSLDTHIKNINDSLNQILLKVGEAKSGDNVAVQQRYLAMTDEESSRKKAVEANDFASRQLVYDIMENWPTEMHAQISQDVVFKSLIKVDGVNIPTPKEIVLDSFSLDYTAEDTLVFPLEGNNETFYLLHPLGYYAASEPGTSIIPAIAHAGALYIGLADATAPSTLTILFEVAEGSANPLKPAGKIAWHYLDTANRWRVFDEQDVRDGTKHFSRSGIVTLSLPPDATNAATRMASGQCWIKASIGGDTDTVCRMVAVRAQAGEVQLVQGAGVEFRERLAPGTIAKPVLADNAVKQVAQPVASFGGKPRETDERFYTRVSERLRHKQRAVTIWDYEHLVLEQFPDVYKVKCINHAGFYQAGGHQVFCEHLPGHVTVIPTPLLANTQYGDPLKPYTPVSLLVDIQEYLDKLKDPFVTLHVRNPRFEEIKLEFDVKFHAQLDEIFYTNELNADIERFLCPWAFDTQAQFSYGGKVSKSALINFIDERPYVDYLSKFKLHQFIRDENGLIRESHMDIEEASGSTGGSVLVSHSQQDGEQLVRHAIKVIQNNEQV